MMWENRLARTALGAYIDQQNDDFEAWRVPLLCYALRYQDRFPFAVLDGVEEYFVYLEPQHKLNLATIDTAVLQDINVGRYEYSYSLNAIAQAFYLLLTTPRMDQATVVQVLNAIFEAFACNLDEADFLATEEAYLLDFLPVLQH